MNAPSMIAGLLKRNPLIFNSITGGVLCASSDAMAQHLEMEKQHQGGDDSSSSTSSLDDNAAIRKRSLDTTNSSRDLNWPYLASSSVVGSGMLSSAATAAAATTTSRLDWVRVVSAGVIGSFFGGMVYPMAYARLDAMWVGTKFATVLKKSLVEIASVGIFVNSISMTTRGILRGDQDSTSVLQHVSKELPDVTRNDFFVWLPYNMLAFSVIPAVLRPTTTAAMEASWQTYISLRAHDFQHHDSKKNDDAALASPLV